MNPSAPDQQPPTGMPMPPGSMPAPPTGAIQPPMQGASSIGPGYSQAPTYAQVMQQEAASHQANGAVVPPAQTQQAAPVRHSNPNSTQNSLLIAEVRDGIVIMNDGSFRSVIMAKSINFDLMSPQEQESVEYAYQGFLNSLYFPVQIFIRSQKVDLQPYLEKLDKIRTEHDNMLLALLMEDYIDYMDQLSQQTNIMDKKFYIVVPYFPIPADGVQALASSKNFFTGLADLFSSKEQHVVVNEATLEKAKTELRNRVQAVLGGLMQCGIKALPLDTQELIELYYDTYNPDTATRQQLKNFNDLTADVITKGQGMALQTHLQRTLQ